MSSSSREEEVCPSSPKKEGVMAIVIFLFSSVASCGGGHGISSRDEEVCPSSPKNERKMTMVIMAYLLEKRRSALLVLKGKGI